MTISGVTSSGGGTYNGTWTILSVPTATTFTVGILSNPGSYTSGGSAIVDQNAFTEGGTATTTGYLSDSVDGQSLVIAGNVAAPGASISSALSDVATVSASGTVNDSTLIPSASGSAAP